MQCSNLRARLETFGDRHVYFLLEQGTVGQRSFVELAAEVGELVDHLRLQHVGPGWRVGIVGPNSIDWLVWDLALMEIGCTVIAFPDEVLLQRGAAVFELYDLAFVARARGNDNPALAGSAHTCWLDDRKPILTARGPTGSSPFPVQEVCALSFSSGASGVPKCLMINPHGIASDVLSYVPEFELRPDDRILLFLPLTLQQQRLLAYAAYWHGISIALCRPEQLFEAMAALRPTLCLAPPLLYEGIYERFAAALEELPARRRRWAESLRSLAKKLPAPLGAPLRRVLFKRVYAALGGNMRLMMTGMAPIKRAVLEWFEELHVPLYEAYGLTETGVIASNTPRAKRIGSVGKPVKGSRIALGEDGEILVHREQFASFGYLPWDGSGEPFQPGAPVATGDIGRFDADGYLYLLGRKKEVIITAQGYKVHPERIESLLNRHPSIAQAVVLGDEQKSLVCVICIRKARTPELEEEIAGEVQRVNDGLDTSARIGKVVLTQERFTLANGLLTRSMKLDRRAIAKRFAMELFGQGDAVAEPTAEELAEVDAELLAIVQETWQVVLGKRNIPLKAAFFDLGGDSLTAMRSMTHLEERLSTAITIRDLYQDPTILGVARLLTRERRAANRERAAAVEMEEGVI
jgi:long-chain acyl-CoA synthetase